MDQPSWSAKQWVLASAVTAAAAGALYLIGQATQPERQPTKQPRKQPQTTGPARVSKKQTTQPEPQKHSLGQVTLPKSAFYPTPPANEADEPTALTNELIESLKLHPPAYQYPLTEEQLKTLFDEGFIVIRKLIPANLCDEMLDQVDERAEQLFKTNSRDLANDSSNSIFLDIWHNQAYYEIRQNADLYSIFCQLLKRHDLTAAIDRVCFLPQARREPTPDDTQVSLMCDTSYWHESPTRYSCSIAVTDQDTETIQLLPGAHKVEEIQRYRTKYMNGDYGETANLTGVDWRTQHFYRDSGFQEAFSERIKLSKGDIIIWNTRLPYALLPSSRGQTQAALICFASFRPASGTSEDNDFRRNIARSLMTVSAPSWLGNGLPAPRSAHSNAEAEANMEPARVSGLGLRLFGVNSWASAQ